MGGGGGVCAWVVVVCGTYVCACMCVHVLCLPLLRSSRGQSSKETASEVHTAVTKDYAVSERDGISYPSEDS